MKKIILTLIAGILLHGFVLAQKAWNQKTNFSGSARNSSIGFSINGKGYLGLGQNASGTKLYDFYEYDPSSNTWNRKADYPGGGSFAASSFVVNGKGYVCFGANNSGTPQKDLWEYTPSTNTWSQKANFPGSARYGTSWFVINDTAFLMTGSPGGPPYLADVWMYVPATNTWSQKSNFPGGSRSHGVGFTVNGIGYFGTGIKDGSNATKDIWKYNKSKDTWSSIADYPNGNITGIIGFEVDKKGYIGTGYNLSTLSKDYYEYNTTANTWKKLDSIPSGHTIRGGSVAFVINKIAYIGTGYGSTVSNSLNDLWSYAPKSNCETDFWSEPNSAGVQSGDTAKFSAISLDTSASYKWQINTGSAFVDISNGGQYSGAKSKNLKISNVKYSINNNHKFRAIALGKTCSDTTINVTLTVTCNNLLKTSPSNVATNNGSTAKFFVQAFNSATTFQWQKDDGTGFKDISNSGQYSGVDNDTLTISDILYSHNNNKFRCVSSYEGCFYNSNAAILTVTCKPIIKNQPTNTTVYKGNKASFGIGVNDAGTSFQWKTKIGSNFQNLSNAGQYDGVVSDSLFIYSADMSNKNQQFKVVLNYKGCKDSSKIVSIDVLCNPIVLKEPENQIKFEGEKAMFTVSTFDANASFTWQINFGTGFQNLSNTSRIEGANKDTLSISNLLLADNNQVFRSILTSEGCSDTSQTALLKVTCKPLINAQPKNKTAFVTATTFLSVTSLDTKVSYAWQSDVGFGFQNLSNAGQYSGVTNDTLSIANLSFTNNNQKFRAILTLGACVETTDIVTLFVSCKPIITGEPANKTAPLLGSAFFNVNSAAPNATYKWQTDVGLGFQNLSNAGQFKGVTNDTLVISNLTAANDNQAFRCLVSDGACYDTTTTATLTIKSGSITNAFEKGKLIVYPNPIANILYIETPGTEKNNALYLYNSNGQLLLQKKIVDDKTQLDLTNFGSGVYYLSFVSDKTFEMRKIIKK